MKRVNWLVVLSVILILLSAVLYYIHFLIFHDAHHIYIYLLGDIAFLPIEVLLVTIIIHQLLNEKEKRTRLNKLNMVIGTFFSEIGTKLLTRFSNYDPNLEEIRKELIVSGEWSANDFQNMRYRLKKYDYNIEIKKVNLTDLQKLLLEKRGFLVMLLENPSLLEHESFTNLLRAVFHLTEELEFRKDFTNLPDSDYAHLASDMKRAYTTLVREYLDYMKYLKNNYPYLFSLAIRTNPFDPNASPVVK